jgi:hypothetical protein
MPASAEANPFRAPAEHVERHGRPLTVRDLRSLLIFAAAYFAACGYGSLFGQTRAAPLWFPDSVLLCALLLTPFGKWWLYLLAALPIRLLPALHPPVPDWFVFAASVNDLLKGAFAAYFLRRVAPDSIRLNNLRKFTVYLGVAVLFVRCFRRLAEQPRARRLGTHSGRLGKNGSLVTQSRTWCSHSHCCIGAADTIANCVLTPSRSFSG